MKERLVTFALALGALVLFYAFFIPKPNAGADNIDLPLSTETRDHGYQAVWRWMEHEGIPVKSLRDPYTHLPALTVGAASDGHILITTLPHRLQVRADEMKALESWVSRGNTLVVLAALDDTPPWALGADEAMFKSLSSMTGLSFQPIPKPGANKAPSGTDSKTSRAFRFAKQVVDPPEVRLKPIGSHPLLAGVEELAALSELPTMQWSAAASDGSGLLAIAEFVTAGDQSAKGPAAWLKRRGQGQVIVFACASLLDNRLVGEPGNSKLLSNIIGWSRASDGMVIFDDDHQGAVDYYDAKAFFRDPRLHRTIEWTILLWLLFVLGWQRLRPTPDEWNPTDVTAFLGVTGDFFAASTSPSSVADRLFQNFFNALRRRFSLPEDGMPTWDMLAVRVAPGSTGRAQLTALHALYDQLQSGKRIDLVRLHNLLSGLLGTLE